MTTISKKLIPNKRFPEFEKSGEWVEKKIKDILNYEQPTNYIVKSDNYITHGTPVLTANKAFILGYTNETIGIYNNVPVIIFDDFTTDKKYVSFPFKVKSSAIKILSAKKDYNVKFIYELMTLINLNPQEHKRYYIGTYQNIDVLVPSLKEQQKIADFLSSVDELIELEQQKLEKLKEYKKGLLQSIFGSNGRDKCVIDNFNCVFDKLKNISMIIMGASPAKEKANTEYGIEFHQGKSFFDYLYIKDSKKYTTDYSKQINEDYIIMSVRAPVGEINLTDREIALGRGLCGIKPFKVNKLYLYYYLLYFKNLINYNAKGLVFDSITKSDVENIYIKFPPDTIQENIGNTLFFLDKIIIEQINKVKKIQEYKKGLLQQLFPN